MGQLVIENAVKAAAALPNADNSLFTALNPAWEGKFLLLASVTEYRDVYDTRYDGYCGSMLELAISLGASSSALLAVDDQFVYAQPATWPVKREGLTRTPPQGFTPVRSNPYFECPKVHAICRLETSTLWFSRPAR